MTKDGIPAAAAYDTINNSWQRWNISCDGIDNPVFRNFSVVGDNLYAILMSNTCQEYYISHLNLSSGDSKIHRSLSFLYLENLGVSRGFRHFRIKYF